MASKRMFSKKIVQSSRFLRLPPTCRLLYYDLGMNADDDGYCEWYPVIQMTGSKESDLEMLHKAELIQVFDKEVLLVTDWKVNNLIRSDRYEPSKYLSIYPSAEPLKLGIPNGNQTATQDRVGEGRRVNTIPPKGGGVGFDSFWEAYPKKLSKKDALKAWNKISPDDTLRVAVMGALEVHKKTEAWTKKGGTFIPYPASWLNGRRWEDVIEEKNYQQSSVTVIV